MIVVSHDRYFLQKIPTRILELESDGLKEYLGKYDYYLEKKAQVASGKKYLEGLKAEGEGGMQNRKELVLSAGAVDEGRNLTEKELRQLNKQREMEERRRKRALEELEIQINSYEQDIMNLEGKMTDPKNALNYQLLADMAEETNRLRALLDEAYTKWAELEM